MSRLRLFAVTLLAWAVAGFAVAQNANYNSAGPTKNDYRLRVVQPLEGAKIVGSSFQVVVDTEIPAERDVRHDASSMPHPDVDVFLDGTRQGRMRDDNNVITLENVAPGPHNILLVALNRSNEVIDRKEVHIITVAAEKPAPVVKHAVPAPAPPPPAAAPAPAPRPEPVAETLPKTATSDPLFVAAGAALLLGGLALRRLV